MEELRIFYEEEVDMGVLVEYNISSGIILN